MSITLQNSKNEKGFHRKFGDTTSGQKRSYGSTDKESAGSSGEEKDDEEDDNEGDEEYDVEDNDEGDRKEKATMKSKAVQKPSSTPPTRQMTVMEALEKDKIKIKRKRSAAAKPLLMLQQKSPVSLITWYNT